MLYLKELTFLNLLIDVSLDLLMMSMNLIDIALSNIKGANYCCAISRINKSEAINLMHNIHMTEKSQTL